MFSCLPVTYTPSFTGKRIRTYVHHTRAVWYRACGIYLFIYHTPHTRHMHAYLYRQMDTDTPRTPNTRIFAHHPHTCRTLVTIPGLIHFFTHTYTEGEWGEREREGERGRDAQMQLTLLEMPAQQWTKTAPFLQPSSMNGDVCLKNCRRSCLRAEEGGVWKRGRGG